MRGGLPTRQCVAQRLQLERQVDRLDHYIIRNRELYRCEVQKRFDPEPHQPIGHTLGHVGGNDTRAIRCVGFLTVMNRGSEWAATGKVTLPVPENFPTVEKTSLIAE